MDLVSDESVADARAGASDVAAAMAASGALDGIFAKIDAGELELTGAEGFIPGLIKAALERGLQAELSEHLGYEKGARRPRCSPIPATARPRRRSRPASGTSSWPPRVTGRARSSRGWCRRAHGVWAGSTR